MPSQKYEPHILATVDKSGLIYIGRKHAGKQCEVYILKPDEQYEVSDSLCEYKRITPSTPIVMETDTAYVLEPEKGKRAYLNKAHCKKVTI